MCDVGAANVTRGANVTVKATIAPPKATIAPPPLPGAMEEPDNTTKAAVANTTTTRKTTTTVTTTTTTTTKTTTTTPKPVVYDPKKVVLSLIDEVMINVTMPPSAGATIAIDNSISFTGNRLLTCLVKEMPFLGTPVVNLTIWKDDKIEMTMPNVTKITKMFANEEWVGENISCGLTGKATMCLSPNDPRVKPFTKRLKELFGYASTCDWLFTAAYKLPGFEPLPFIKSVNITTKPPPSPLMSLQGDTGSSYPVFALAFFPLAEFVFKIRPPETFDVWLALYGCQVSGSLMMMIWTMSLMIKHVGIIIKFERRKHEYDRYKRYNKMRADSEKEASQQSE
ncbi:hypothetical protein Btru_032764 [Bulinus truncatus]|nr:hypothetical protein Btru_032764 [Bulinus truncatus]